MPTKQVNETKVLSNTSKFLITHYRTVTRDEETNDLVSVDSDYTVLELRDAPVPNDDFAVHVNRDGTDMYSAVILGITGLRTDVEVLGAIRLKRPPAPYEPTGAHRKAPGDGPLCMRGSSENLPKAMAAAMLELVAPKAASVEREFGLHQLEATIRMRVRRAIEAAGNPPQQQQRAGA